MRKVWWCFLVRFLDYGEARGGFLLFIQRGVDSWQWKMRSWMVNEVIRVLWRVERCLDCLYTWWVGKCFILFMYMISLKPSHENRIRSKWRMFAFHPFRGNFSHCTPSNQWLCWRLKAIIAEDYGYSVTSASSCPNFFSLLVDTLFHTGSQRHDDDT